MSFKAQDPNFEQRVRDSYAKQIVMGTIGARLHKVEAGEVEIVLPYRADLTQQDGFLHAGIVTTIVDSACGYAAFSLMASDSAVLSVEFKINLCAPAAGDMFLARGKVKRRGRTLTVTEGEVFNNNDGSGKLIAVMQGTMIELKPDT